MPKFSKAVSALRTSEIRELMSLVAKPDIISFAGGMPASDLFPVEETETLFRQLDRASRQAAFQYGPTSGLPSLLESLGGALEAKGLPVKKNRLIVTTGSQQALSLLAKAFIDPGDRVLVETPSFIGALSAFRACQAKVQGVPMDHEGIEITTLSDETAVKPPAKFLYLTPHFHNPAGLLYTEKRKQAVIGLLRGKELPVIEDDAYGDLYFHEEDLPRLKPFKAIDPEGIDICYTGSFSKILGPGLRLGWLLAPEPIAAKCELLKQSADACSPSFTQVLADAFIRSGKLYNYIETVRLEYKQRARTMSEALRNSLPDYVEWNEPRGGFYIWLKLPNGCDSSAVMQKSLEQGAVFVTGKTFDPGGRRNDAIRLSYCNNSIEEIRQGIPIVAKAIRSVCG